MMKNKKKGKKRGKKKKKSAGDTMDGIEAIRAVLRGEDVVFDEVTVDPTPWPMHMVGPKFHRVVAEGGILRIHVDLGADDDLFVGFERVDEDGDYIVYRRLGADANDGGGPGADDEYI